MKRFLMVALMSAGVGVMGAAGVPGACQVDLSQVIDQLSAEQIDTILEILSDQVEQGTLDFGGVEPTDEEPAFGEPEDDFNEVPLDEVPEDPELVPDGEAGGEHGVLAGRFFTEDVEADCWTSPGVFRGRWANADRSRWGYIRGAFRPLPAEGEEAPTKQIPELEGTVVAEGELHGKIISPDGTFVGVMRGNYVKVEDGRAFFAGDWVDRHGVALGKMRGRWSNLTEADGGVFEGNWVRISLRDIPQEFAEYAFEEGDFGGLTTDDEEPLFGEDPEYYPRLVIDEPVEDEEMPEEVTPECVQGLLGGFFLNENGTPPDEEGGVLRGHWITVGLGVHGVLRGHYEPLAEQDGGVFYGKYISTGVLDGEEAGQFKGMIRGRYGILPNGLSIFVGAWFNEALENMGPILGHWHYIPELGEGVFKGRWAEACPPPVDGEEPPREGDQPPEDGIQPPDGQPQPPGDRPEPPEGGEEPPGDQPVPPSGDQPSPPPSPVD